MKSLLIGLGVLAGAAFVIGFLIPLFLGEIVWLIKPDWIETTYGIPDWLDLCAAGSITLYLIVVIPIGLIALIVLAIAVGEMVRE